MVIDLGLTCLRLSVPLKIWIAYQLSVALKIWNVNSTHMGKFGILDTRMLFFPLLSE